VQTEGAGRGQGDAAALVSGQSATEEADQDGDEVAWSDPATRAIYRRGMRAVWVLFGVVLVAFALFVLYTVVRKRHAEDLNKHGVKTSGVVVHLDRDPCSGGKDEPLSVRALIRFPVDGSSQLHSYNTTCSDGLFVGALVPIAYDRHDPSDFAVNNSVSQNGAISTLFMLGFAIAFPSAIVGCAMFLSRLRFKSLLEQTRWVRTTCDFTRVPGSMGRFAVEIWTADGRSVFDVSDSFNRVVRKPGVQDMLIAGSDPNVRVIRQPDGKRMLMIRRPTNEASRKKLEQLVHQPWRWSLRSRSRCSASRAARTTCCRPWRSRCRCSAGSR
jgi:hypothetical protein